MSLSTCNTALSTAYFVTMVVKPCSAQTRVKISEIVEVSGDIRDVSSSKSCSGRRRKILKRPQNKDGIADWSLFTSCSGRYRNHQTHAMCSFLLAPEVPFPIGSTSTAGAYLIYVMGGFWGARQGLIRVVLKRCFGTRGRDGCLQKEEEEGERGGINKEGGSEEVINKKSWFFLNRRGSKGGREVSKKEEDVCFQQQRGGGRVHKKRRVFKKRWG